MKNRYFNFFCLLFIISICNSCQRQEKFQNQWLGETHQEIHAQIEEQFQGFSRTMMEVNYRFQELYWAGVDQNWNYADYQLEHILEALEQGFVRRPDREASSQIFVQQAIPQLYETVHEANHNRFLETFRSFTASCNTCHAMEEVSFILIKTPEIRASVVHY